VKRERHVRVHAGPWRDAARSGLAVVVLLVSSTAYCAAVESDQAWTGRRIMDEVFERHEQFPYVFEELSMILLDRDDHRDVRKARRFSRVETDGTVKYLLVFDNPPEVRGLALLAIRQPGGEGTSQIYVPAFGSELKTSAGDLRGNQFLGTDFSVEDLLAEILSNFRYVRVADREIDDVPHFVVEAFPEDPELERITGYGLRRHFIRKDIFYIVRTDYYDRQLRFVKSQTHHDLKRVDGDMWRANMVLMEDHREHHKTLLKVNERVFSGNYVPAELFTADWLLHNRHIEGHRPSLVQETPDGPAPVGDSKAHAE
jgi:hypothetical protein